MITLCEGHVYRDQHGNAWPGVTECIRAAGLMDDRWWTEYARLRGDYVHRACAMYDRGTLDESSLDDAIRPHVEAWIAFRRETDYQPQLTEVVVSHPYLRYAGTLDSAGMLNGFAVVIDRKTGSCPPWAGVQLAGYAECIGSPRRFSIALLSNGRYRLREHAASGDYGVFHGCLAIRNWKESNK